MIRKVTNIIPLLWITGCLLFQHHAVGSTSYPELPNDTSITISNTDTTIIKSDSISTAQTDTSEKEDEMLKSKIKYHARDSMRVDVENEIVYLYGEATVDYEELHLKSDYIMIDMHKKELYAEGSTDSLGHLIGKPEFSEKQQQFKANTIRYNFESKKGKISYVVTKEGEGYIHGEVVKKDQNDDFFIRNGQYTTCDSDTPHFSIMSRKLKVINDNKIITGPAFLVIEQVQTPLILPFGFFPNKNGRSSGIIFPAFGESAEHGFFFQHLGYYFGFNDYFNAAITTDLYTKGSYTLNLATVYTNRYHYKGNFMLSYAKMVTSEPELPDYAVSKDFHVNWSHNQDPKANPYHNFNASVNLGSSSYFQNTISSPTNFLSNTFQSSINYTKIFPNQPFNLGISATHSQNTLTRDFRINLPDVSFGISRLTPLKRENSAGGEMWYEKIGASYSLRATNFIQTKDSLLKNSSLNDLQNGLIHTIPLSTSLKFLKYLTLTPSVNYTGRFYGKTTRYEWNVSENKVDTFEDNRAILENDFLFSAGLSTRIYGMYQFKKGAITAIRHVMNPTASYSWRPDYGEPKYGYYKTVQTDSLGNIQTYSIFNNGVYGGPAYGKYGNISFGLDNNLEMKVKVNSDSGLTTKKIKLFESLRIAGNYNLAADSMNLSPFSFSGRTTLFDKVGINLTSTLNPYAYDKNNRDYDRYQYDVDGRLVRLTYSSLSINFSLAGKSEQANLKKHTQDELDYLKQHPEDYADFKVPYNLSVNYTSSYSRTGNLEPVINQSASINGDVNLTPKWKVGFNSWYSFTENRFTNLYINIFRDLHCWEMHLNWIPFGGQESYVFQINVKSSLLQDLKLTKHSELNRALF